MMIPGYVFAKFRYHFTMRQLKTLSLFHVSGIKPISGFAILKVVFC